MSNFETTRVMGAAVAPQDRTLVVPPGGGAATIAMPGQGDAFRTQMGGTTICPICSSTTPLMDPYCGDCGFLLASPPIEDASPPAEEIPAAELVDPQTGRRFRLRVGVNTLGRQGTDILVNDGTVSRSHARITVENGTVTIEDLGSSNGTKVGDQRLVANQPVPASAGQTLRFGNWSLSLEVGDSAAYPSAADSTIAMPAAPDTLDKTLASTAFSNEDTFIASSLVVAPPTVPSSGSDDPVSGGALVGTLRRIEGSGDDIAVTEGVVSIGRKPGNTVVLTGDAYVSGRHAEIVTDSTGTYISDVGSTNGTVVNGVKIVPNERLMLREGDELHIGQNKFRFEAFTGAETGDNNDELMDESLDESGRV